MPNYLTPDTIKPTNIIVRMPNWLGDLVMATPVLADLRKRWPDAKITALCQGGLGTVLQEDPNVDEIIVFKGSKEGGGKTSGADCLSKLRQGRYDLGVLLTGSFSSAWWFWRAGVKNRIGFTGRWRRLLLDFPISVPPAREMQHLVVTYKNLLEPLGIPLSSTAPCLYVTEEEKKDAEKKLSESGIRRTDFVIGINPGAAYGSAKCWLPERFQELTLRLLRLPNVKVIFFGDKAGTPLVEGICNEIAGNVVNFAGKTTLRELIALIEACNLFLTNDSGPMHIASALGVPLIALFGSTSDTATGPYRGGKVIHKHVSCSPCYRRECPIDFRCMKGIEVEEVYQAITKRINRVE